MSELAELLERAKAATGPDRFVEEDIALSLETGWSWNDSIRAFHTPEGYQDRPPAYTASIDAALALVERLLPGLVINATKIGDGSGLWQVVEAWHGDIDVVPDCAPMDPRPGALAFLEVLLSALSQQEAK